LFKELKLSLHDKKNSAQSAYYEQSFIVWAYSFIHPGLGRSLNFTIASPSDKAPSNVTCLGQILVYLFYNLVGRQLAFIPLPVGQVRLKSYLHSTKIYTEPCEHG